MTDNCGTAYADMVNSDEIFAAAITKDPGLADALDVGSCKTFREEKDEQTSAEVCMGANLGPYCAGPKVDAKTDKTITETTEGCESVAIQHALNVGISKALSCTANELSKKLNTDASTIQAMKVVFKNVKTGGGDFTYKSEQKIETDAQVIDFTSQEVQKEFENTVEQELETLQESMQSTETDTFATGNSNKSLQQQITASISSTADMNISEVISETITSLCSKQGQELIFENIDTEGGNVDVENIQESIQKVVVDSVTKQVVGHISKNSSMQKNISSAKSAQENIRKTKNLYAGMGVVMVVMMLIVLACMFVFSIHRVGHKYMLPVYRVICFYSSFFILILMLSIPIFREFVPIWVMALIFFVIALIISFVEIGKNNEKISFGNGSQFLFQPYPDAENICDDDGKYCILYKNNKNYDEENIIFKSAFSKDTASLIQNLQQ